MSWKSRTHGPGSPATSFESVDEGGERDFSCSARETFLLSFSVEVCRHLTSVYSRYLIFFLLTLFFFFN
jgi:hypothetical protein